ncbi:G5 domain-containing protein [Globicatella sanguinis]|nr:G5 domain-containing protein [Globicatella sanguinis]
MHKQYRYTLRKTTLGLASVAISAFLAGQAPTVDAAEAAEIINVEGTLSVIGESETTAPVSEVVPEANTVEETPAETPVVEAASSEATEADTNNLSEAASAESIAETELAATNQENNEVNTQDVSESASSQAKEEASVGPASEGNREANTVEETAQDELATTMSQPSATDVQAESEKLDISAEVAASQQRAAATSEPNYAEDEKKINNYNENERYKETDLQRGDTNQALLRTDENVEKDGLKFNFKNPSEESPSKTEYGYQITIDKKTGQRTYTMVYVTDSGLIPVYPGEKPMMGEGDKLTPESPEVTYKPNENGEITAAGRQRNLDYNASEETLKHINNKDNDSTSFGFNDNYTRDNPNIKFFGDSFILGYKVNPWPNENDKLEELKLNKNNYDEKSKYFVQGQEIDTGIKVDNIDENAKERIVGQVYNPITGKIVPGASAYIGDNGNIHIKMPEGALKKDENGKTVINENSIFNTPEFKGLQTFDVQFFARPRTADEFKTIAETPDGSGEIGIYTETGAGTADINHKGTNVTIDKQGIDRYDHYNLIGSFNLNLDDTRYYDQKFEDGNGDDTTKVTSSAVKPGEPFKVGIVEPENSGETDKSAEEMNEAEARGEASGNLIMDFIERQNKGKAEVDQWKVELHKGDIANFTITPPKSAKAGDFMAIPIEYTYTNGSKDVHWFHFVVQESDYIKPEYETQVNYPAKEQTSPATVTEDGKRIPPSSYTLPSTLEKDEAGNHLVTDDSGNKWTVKLDEKTGQVTAKPVVPTAFNGGEKLTVPVIAHYVDEQKPGEDIIEEVNAYFVIEEKANMTPRYNAKVGQEGDVLSSDVILNTEDKYNRRPGKYTLDSDTYTDDKGNVWNVTIDEKTGKVTAMVPNAEEGKTVDGALLNVPVTAHYYEEDGKLEVGTKNTEVQFMAYGTNGTVEKILEIPFETKVEKDPKLKKGEIKVITEGEKGSKKVTYNIEDSKITDTKEEKLTDPIDRLIYVGEGTNDGTHTIEEKVEVPFEVEVQFDDSLKPGEQKVTQEGVPGEKTRTTTLTIQDGEVVDATTTDFKTTTEPVKKIIKVGRNTDGKIVHDEVIPFETKVEVNNELAKGEWRYKKIGDVELKGKVGSKKTTYTIENSEVTDTKVEETKPENAVIEVGGKDFEGVIEHKEEIPFKYKVEEVDTLKKGEYEIVKPGTVGTKTTTWKIVNSQVDGEPTVSTKAAEDAIIRVGKGTLDGTHKIEEKVEVPFETIVEFDDSLKPGEQKVEIEGVPGEKTRTNTLTIVDGEVTKTEEGTFEQTKAPVKRIVKVGAAKSNGTYEHTNTIPFEVEVRVNPELKKGEHKVVQKGEVGEEKYTITIENSKVTKISDAAITKSPVKEIIEVGSQDFTGEINYVDKDPIPFETEVTVDPSLKPGEIVEDQKGELGEQETKITRTITNGEASEENRGVTNVIKDPVTRKIRVGSKTDGQYKDVETIPFEIEVRKDPSLKKGEWKYAEINGVQQTGESGLKERTLTIENSKVTDESEFKTIREPKKAVILVGDEDFTGTFETKKTEAVEFETEYKVNNELKPGEVKVVQDGELGEKETPVTHTIENGKVTKSENGETKQTKAPVKRIVEVGPGTTDGTHTYTSKKPFEVEVRVNPELKKGEHKVVQQGVEGEEEYTITIENSKVTNTSEPKETKAPVNEIIEVGTEDFTGTHETKKTKAIEFETEYIIDNSLEPGTTEVIQNGELGEEETTITHTIVNGEVTKSENGETKQTKAPIKRIVKVGPAKTDGTHTYTSKKPFEVEVRVNPELKKGEHKVVQQGVEGEEEYTITIENSKVTNTSEPKETKAPVKEIIEVGSQEFEGEVKHTEELPFGYKVEEVDNLQKGEYRIVKPGKVGIKTTTWTIKDSKVDGEPKEEIVLAEDALIQVGKGTSEGTHEIKEKKEIPFETRVEYDDTLEAGQRKETGGTPGEQERTNTLVIKDGKVVETKAGEFKTTKDPVEKVIKIGTKPIVKEVEKPFETEYIYDENVEMGKEEEVTPGENGKVTITTSYDKDQGKLVTKEEAKDSVKRVVKVGTRPVVKEESIPNNTQYKHNPELKDGEIKKIKDGTPGKVIITTSFNKETGKFETKVERTEPTDAVYEYGSKTDGKVTVENEVPFEVEIIEDAEMEAGKSETVQEGKTGKKETTITIENSKEVSREENITEQPIKKIVKVGTKCKCEIPPVNPEDPKDPEKPEIPEESETPEKPEDPETPEKPEDPETPEKPEDPEKPEESETPEKPEDPETPEKPEDPETPEKPEEPETPEKPEDPETPEAPGEKEPKRFTEIHYNKAKVLPETGEESSKSLLAIGVMSLLSGFSLITKKSKKEDH